MVLAKLTRGRYGARWRCWAWLLLALRLAVPLPLLPAGAASAPIQIQMPPDRVIYQPVHTPRPSATRPSQPVQTAAPTPAASTAPVSTAAPEGLPTEQAQPAPITVGGVLLTLWAAGGLAVLGWNLMAHLRFRRYLARWCRPAEEPDTELACDEGALKRLPREEHAAYGRAILQAVAALRKEKA